MGNLIRAGTCRLCGAARDNGPLYDVARPATVSEVSGRLTTAGAYENMPSSPRHFPPPWSAELQPNYYVVRRITANIAKLPDLLRKD